MLKTLVRWRAEPRNTELAAVIADPAAVGLGLILSSGVSVLTGLRWPLWMLLGGLAGYTLSGSV